MDLAAEAAGPHAHTGRPNAIVFAQPIVVVRIFESEGYPKLSLEISLTDQVIDLLEQRTDVALCSGPLKSSQLIARKLGSVRMIIVGSPGYFARYGIPKTPDELTQHNRLGFSYARAAKGWPLINEGVQRTIPPSGNVQVSDGEALRTLAVNGVGLVRLASFIVRDDIAANRLIPVLEEFNPGDIDELHASILGRVGSCRSGSASSWSF